MRLSYLRSFRLVAELGSVSKAADQLWLSQPAVSMAIKRLESILGVPLFDRHGNRLALNDNGRACLKFARRVEDLVEGLVQELNTSARESPVVTIGSHPVTARVILPPILQEFHRCAPLTRVLVKDLPPSEVIDRIRRRELDLGLLSRLHLEPDLAAEPVLSERLWIVARPDHPLTQLSDVEPERLLQEPFVALEPNTDSHHQLHLWATSLGLPLRVVMEVSSEDLLLEAALRGLGLALIGEETLSSSIQSGTLSILPLPGMPLYRTMYVLYSSLAHLSSPSRILLEVLIERHLAAVPTPVVDKTRGLPAG